MGWPPARSQQQMTVTMCYSVHCIHVQPGTEAETGDVVAAGACWAWSVHGRAASPPAAQPPRQAFPVSAQSNYHFQAAPGLQVRAPVTARLARALRSLARLSGHSARTSNPH